MNIKNILPAILITIVLTSCAEILSVIIAPNKCNFCEVRDVFGTIVWSESGSYFSNIETKCKAEAYDLERNGSSHTCSCYIDSCK